MNETAQAQVANSVSPEQAVADDQKFSIHSWTPHDIVLRDAWFPLAHSDAVKSKPIRRAVYSHSFFLWRDKGSLHATEFHPDEKPSAVLSEFTAGTGRYPVTERYGYVWGWFGNPNAADLNQLPNIPYLPPKGGLPSYTRGTVRFDCAAPLSLENLIDLTHADFLHANVVGDEKSEHEYIEVFNTAETITMVRHCRAKSIAPVMRFFSGVKAKTQDVRQVIHIYLRSHCALAYGRFRPGDDVPLFHPCVPETRDRTRMDYTLNTTNAKNLFRYVMPNSAYIISRQDSSMTSPLSPRYMRPEARRDLHSRFDVPDQKYRVLMQALAARQAAGDYSYGGEVLSRDASEICGIDKNLYPYD